MMLHRSSWRIRHYQTTFREAFRSTRATGISILLVSLLVSAVSADEIQFSRDVLPILSENCFQCHGPDEEQRQADLRLDDESSALPVLNRLRGSDSELLRRIESTDPDEMMPPADSNLHLTQEQRKLLQQWVRQGAPWGKHWSFERLTAPEIPATVFPDSPSNNPIDRFVQARLPKVGLIPSPPADRSTLLRRVTLDLIGLPPTIDEQDAFLKDTAPDAWQRVVERLLASPRFGERMAWDWLNTARYADSNGYQGDRERTMWPWREWVVDAFNSNMPFDEFTILQLAGDLLPNATFEQNLATGFCRNHMINGEGGRIAEENRVDYVMDMTETMGTVWLGLTLNCCRCHDHKFDPLKQQDYYQFFAFFNQTPVNGGGGDPQTAPNIVAPGRAQRERIATIETKLGKLEKRLLQRANVISPGQTRWETLAHEQLHSPWTVLHPARATATHQTLEIQEDESILASGPNPTNDDYKVVASLPPGTLSAVRLEALRHSSMTGGGLTRSDSGNFVLTAIEFTLVTNGQQTRLQPESAAATYEQGSHQIRTAFDGKPETGWAVYEGRPVDRNHAAIFRFSAVNIPQSAHLEVVLKHESPHASHNLGRFRLSITADEQAELSGPDQLLADLKTPAEKRSNDQKTRILEAYRRTDSEYVSLEDRLEQLTTERDEIRQRAPKVMVMEDRAESRDTFILTRGLYNAPTEKKVVPGTPTSLPGLPDHNQGNRLDLARWLMSDSNPLTARVTVNRFWQQIFGIGLVKTTEDFGVQGEYPIHKDLLDWLAADFRDHGWNVKRLIRQIVTSNTYRQSSMIRMIRMPNGNRMSERELDPDNRLLGRSPRYRWPSFALRDQALSACGLLNPKMGGPPVNTYQPAGVWAEPTFGRKKHSPDKGSDLYRRSLYIFWRRIVAPTVFFDNATRQTCMVKVLRTNTPLHSLLTFNETTYVEAARTLAQELLSSEQTDEQLVEYAFRRICCRTISEQEKQILLQGLHRSRNEYRTNGETALSLVTVGDSKRNEALDVVEHAAWTSLCLALLNLDETLTRE